MSARSRTRLAVLFAAVFVAPAALSAQQPPQEQAPDTTELVFRREVYGYPSYERRNPFRPLIASDESGPRFEELTLLGIIYAERPEQSVALFGTRGGSGGQGGARTFRVREGETLGNTRILDIQLSRVIVQVTEFGLTEQRVLELRRPSEGGP